VMKTVLLFAFVFAISGALTWGTIALVARIRSRKLLLLAAWVAPIVAGMIAFEVGMHYGVANAVVEPASEAKDAGQLILLASLVFATLAAYAALLGSAVASFLTYRRFGK
jgi:hypothetical protein